MADETQDNSGPLSQDDIDAALNSAGDQDAPSDDSAPSEPAGSLTQDDIDAALDGMSSALSPAGGESAEPAGAAADGGALSQDDIDAALAGGVDADEGPSVALSQDDIDAALGGEQADEPAGALSQDDIDAALAGGSGGQESSGPLSQDDIDAALGGDMDDLGGALDQDDINAVLSGVAQGEDPSEASTQEMSIEDIGESLNQAHIDAALGAAGIDAGAQASQAAPTEAMASVPPQAVPPASTGNLVQNADVRSLELPDFAAVEAAVQVNATNIELLRDVELDVKIELGRSRMLVEDVLRLDSGAVVELDKLAGDPVDVFVNERLVARGEVLVLNDNFCVRINEILAPVANVGELTA